MDGAFTDFLSAAADSLDAFDSALTHGLNAFDGALAYGLGHFFAALADCFYAFDSAFADHSGSAPDRFNASDSALADGFNPFYRTFADHFGPCYGAFTNGFNPFNRSLANRFNASDSTFAYGFHPFDCTLADGLDALDGAFSDVANAFADRFGGVADNGMIPALLILELMSRHGKTLHELLAPLREKYFISGEINTKLARMDQVAPKLDQIAKRYADGRQERIDGLSVEYPGWHFNVRASNTEPLLRLNLEATTRAMMAAQRDEVLALIRS